MKASICWGVMFALTALALILTLLLSPPTRENAITGDDIFQAGTEVGVRFSARVPPFLMLSAVVDTEPAPDEESPGIDPAGEEPEIPGASLEEEPATGTEPGEPEQPPFTGAPGGYSYVEPDYPGYSPSDGYIYSPAASDGDTLQEINENLQVMLWLQSMCIASAVVYLVCRIVYPLFRGF